MLKSMTGFGKASEQIENKTVSVEVKSLNSQKGLDLGIKLPGRYRNIEYDLRNMASGILQRGKVDIYINIENHNEADEASLNRPLILSYLHELKSLADEAGVPADNLLSAVLKLPDIIGESPDEPGRDETKQIIEACTHALNQLDNFRITEGKSQTEDLLIRIELIERHAISLRSEDKRRIQDIRKRLSANLESFIPKDKIDQNRYEQEVIYYIEKLDINEELSRLASHCDYFRTVMNDKEEMKGRKLNFISQEMGREINTIGSKANDAVMQKIVVGMKDELEKIKEQTNNIL